MSRITGLDHPPHWAALLLDLDGTLMSVETISPRVAKAVQAAARSIPVSIATGRQPSETRHYARRLGLTTPQICAGGSALLDPVTGGLLWHSSLPHEVAREIIALLRPQAVNITATALDGRDAGPQDMETGELTRISAMDMTLDAAEELAAFYASEPSLHVVKVYLHYNGLWAVDFTPAGVNKGTAARQLCQMLGIEPRRTVGAGDSYNDLPLLEVCGLKIVMGNAPAEMKALADYVAPAVEEDGLAVALEELLLPRLGDA